MMNKATKAYLREVQLLAAEKKERDKKGLFIAEGLKIVKDIAGHGHKPESVLVCSDVANIPGKKGFLSWLEESRIPVYDTGKKEFDRISALQHSQGILAVIAKKKHVPESSMGSGRRLILLCDGIQDPGNLGTIFRAGVAFGADAIVFNGDNVDMYNPKVVRASSGAITDIPAFEYSAELLLKLKDMGYKLFVSTVDESGAKEIRNIKGSPEKAILAFGSEGRGVSEAILSQADDYFHIGIKKSMESLNVTTAVAISLFVFSGLSSGE